MVYTTNVYTMIRTQVYLTKEERDGLKAASEATGKKQSELIREAVDQYLEVARGERRQAILKEAAGLWADRKDLPDFKKERESWDHE